MLRIFCMYIYMCYFALLAKRTNQNKNKTERKKAATAAHYKAEEERNERKAKKYQYKQQ